MTHDEIVTKVLEAMTLTLQESWAGDVEVRREDEAAWDSLKHVELIFVLEDIFAVQFSEEEMASMDSLSSIVSSLEHHLAP